MEWGRLENGWQDHFQDIIPVLVILLPSPFPSISISLDRDETLVSQNIYQFETRILLTIDSIVATLSVCMDREREKERE